MDKKLRILVTGERDDMESRCPQEWAGEGIPLEWTSLPVLEFRRLPIDPSLLQDLVSKPRNWIIFPSARAVTFWNEALLEAELDFPIETQVACVGYQTAEWASRDGYSADFYPSEPGTEGFLKEFEFLVATHEVKPSVVIPMALGGRTTLRDSLKAAGCDVLAVPLYETSPAKDLSERYSQHQVNGCAAIIFTSPSSVDAFRSCFQIPKNVKVASLGKFTSAYLTSLGLDHKVLPSGDFQKIGEVLC